MDINNYQPISLILVLHKLLMKIITRPNEAAVENQLTPNQASFCKGYSTLDHLHALNMAIKKCHEYNLRLSMLFINFQKTFIITFASSEVAIDVWCGVHQGDTLSPKLFILCLQYVLNGISWAQRGLKVGSQRLPYLAYADDIVLLAHDVAELQSMADNLSTACAAIGLKVNVAKTKWLSTKDARHQLHLCGKPIERVTSFIYLGQLLNWPRDHNKEISRRLAAGWAAFNKCKLFFTVLRIQMKLK
uniref:Reverse transcriptase domain-containing protein n=1 Tax=Plectus sambesii TaxID=2011161 RepID=A0A914W7U0_9BILA